MNSHRALVSRGGATLAVLAIVLSACRGGVTTAPSVAAPPSAATGGASAPASQVAAASLAACGTVNIAVNPWVGYEADAAVVSYLLTNKLGCTVVKKNIDEQTPGRASRRRGRRDPRELGPRRPGREIHHDRQGRPGSGLERQRGDHRLVRPEVLCRRQPRHPDATDPTILNKYADQFKTSESGDKGQILDGDPSFVTNDRG